MTLQDEPIETINTWINEVSKIVSDWEKMAQIGLTLTVIIGVLGVFLTTINGISNRHCKVASSIIGAVIGIITVVLNVVFYNDYRVYNKLNNEGYEILHDIILKKNLYIREENPDNKITIFEEITNLRVKINKIPHKKLFSNNIGNINLLIKSSYANESLPSWIKSPPDDDGKLFFIGSSSKFILEDALLNAKEDVLKNFDGFLEDRLKHKDELLFERLEKRLIKEASHIEPNSDRSSTVYNLYSLNKSDIRIELQFLSLTASNQLFSTSEKIQDKLEKPQKDYFYSTIKFDPEEILLAKKVVKDFSVLLNMYEQSLNKLIEHKERCSKIDMKTSDIDTIFDTRGPCQRGIEILTKRLRKQARELDKLEVRVESLRKYIKVYSDEIENPFGF